MKGAITDNLNDFDVLIKNIKNYTISGAVEAVTVKEPRNSRRKIRNAMLR